MDFRSFMVFKEQQYGHVSSQLNKTEKNETYCKLEKHRNVIKDGF